MKSRMLMMAVVAGLFGLANVASAETVTATFTGTVNLASDANGGLPSASDGDTLVATYVFDLDQTTISSILPTGGFAYGPYGSFVSASVSINGVTGVLPAFTSGQLTGETEVFDTGSVIDAEVTGAPGAHLDSNVTGMDFAWNLITPTGFSYAPTSADQTAIQLGDEGGDLLSADVSKVTLSVTSAAPEPATWALLFAGVAGVGMALRRRRTFAPMF